MADFANCPACHGRGVIPLAEAERIEVHAEANRDVARAGQREREAGMLRANLERRKAEAEARQAEIEALVSGTLNGRRERHERQLQAAASGLQHTPGQLAALQVRLTKLEAEREAVP
jgi:hypothetical protein